MGMRKDEEVAKEMLAIAKEFHKRANIASITDSRNAIQIHRLANRLEDCVVELNVIDFEEDAE